MNAQANEAAPSSKKKVEYEKVTMSDGREVSFPGSPDAPKARKMLKESIFDSEGNYIGTRFDFRNGETRTFEAPARDLKTPEGVYLHAKSEAHGNEQKIGDETAGAKSIGDMVDAVDECITRLSKGEWFVEGVGVGAGGTSILLRALVEHTGKPIENLREWLKTKTPPQKQAMRRSEQLRPIVERIEAEEASKTSHVDTGALFAELDAAA